MSSTLNFALITRALASDKGRDYESEDFSSAKASFYGFDTIRSVICGHFAWNVWKFVFQKIEDGKFSSDVIRYKRVYSTPVHQCYIFERAERDAILVNFYSEPEIGLHNYFHMNFHDTASVPDFKFGRNGLVDAAFELDGEFGPVSFDGGIDISKFERLMSTVDFFRPVIADAVMAEIASLGLESYLAQFRQEHIPFVELIIEDGGAAGQNVVTVVETYLSERLTSAAEVIAKLEEQAFTLINPTGEQWGHIAVQETGCNDAVFSVGNFSTARRGIVQFNKFGGRLVGIEGRLGNVAAVHMAKLSSDPKIFLKQVQSFIEGGEIVARQLSFEVSTKSIKYPEPGLEGRELYEYGLVFPFQRLLEPYNTVECVDAKKAVEILSGKDWSGIGWPLQ